MLRLWCPLLHKVTDNVHVSFQVLGHVAVQLMHDATRVAFLGLLQDGLEYLTLDVVRELLPTVAPVKENQVK